MSILPASTASSLAQLVPDEPSGDNGCIPLCPVRRGNVHRCDSSARCAAFGWLFLFMVLSFAFAMFYRLGFVVLAERGSTYKGRVIPEVISLFF